MAPSSPEIVLNPERAVARSRISFYFIAHLALLAVMLVGFSPTFYLRAFFSVPRIPPVLYVHGVVLTLWFLPPFCRRCSFERSVFACTGSWATSPRAMRRS